MEFSGVENWLRHHQPPQLRHRLSAAALLDCEMRAAHTHILWCVMDGKVEEGKESRCIQKTPKGRRATTVAPPWHITVERKAREPTGSLLLQNPRHTMKETTDDGWSDLETISDKLSGKPTPQLTIHSNFPCFKTRQGFRLDHFREQWCGMRHQKPHMMAAMEDVMLILGRSHAPSLILGNLGAVHNNEENHSSDGGGIKIIVVPL
ncbi:hypothetical protein E3N88_23331 [Mikania micrantha]|uniref:Uncharacterized protein n=1 Tax=Mikania micrantha TaxID=192012 RepID=A0A5N6NEP9_9ASTR|nr:hypothetical protein E3N88_23331 [Mikania micrantha]